MGFLYYLPDVSEQFFSFIPVPNLVYIILNIILSSVKELWECASIYSNKEIIM